MLPSDGFSEGCSKAFWLSEPMLPSCMTRRPPCLLSDESDWTSGATSLLGERDLIGPSDRLSCYGRFWLACLIELSLANAFDWTVQLTCPWQTLLIGWFADQLLASSIGFLDMRCQTCKDADKENDYAKASSLRWRIRNNTPFWPVFDV